MDKYTGSKKLRIAHFPSLSKPNNHLFVCFFTITRGIKGTVAYFAFTHLFIFLFLFFYFQKHSICGVAPDLTYLK